MSLTYTAEQVINKAAGDLGRLIPGEALGAVEHDVLSIALDNVISEIAKIIAINDRDEVPALVFEVVAALTAAFGASDFSNTPVNYPNVIHPLEMRLRYLVAQTPTYEALQSYYF